MKPRYPVRGDPQPDRYDTTSLAEPPRIVARTLTEQFLRRHRRSLRGGRPRDDPLTGHLFRPSPLSVGSQWLEPERG